MGRIRCDECAKKFDLVNDIKYMDWLSLANLLQFLLSEEYIEKETYDTAFGQLMTFKEYAISELESHA